MIEHDMAFISRLCDPVIVMAEGEVLATGTAAEVQQDEAVIEAYLGGGRKVARKTTDGSAAGNAAESAANNTGHPS